MRYITWADNICTVGWTSIHASLSPNDMEWLLSMHPQGWLTPTFFPPWGHSRAKVTPELARSHWGEAEKRYYFSFPEDQQGQALLVALKIKGMTGERYMSARPEWVRKRKEWGSYAQAS